MKVKELIKYILVSMIQGFTEPLPISSSGHMIIVRNFLNIKNQDLTLEIFLNFASTLAIALFLFTRRIYIKDLFNKSLIIKLIIASIPAVIIGFIFKDKIETFILNNKYIGFTLLITSVLLLTSFFLINKYHTNNITYLNSFKLGLAQSVALMPGISRMGCVMTAGITQGINFKKVLDFSNLLYLIISVGSLVLAIPDLINIDLHLIPYYLISFLVTFVFTYLSVQWFYNIISKNSLLIFFFYTLILGTILLTS
jgi:undecaprenyl-diphosphatase